MRPGGRSLRGPRDLIWYLSKALQLLGLVVMLDAVTAGIFRAAGMGQELRLSLVGVILFTIGYLLDRRGRAG